MTTSAVPRAHHASPSVRAVAHMLALLVLCLAGAAFSQPAAASTFPAPLGRYVVAEGQLGMAVTMDLVARPERAADAYDIVAEFRAPGAAASCGGTLKGRSRYIERLCDAVLKDGVMLVTAEATYRRDPADPDRWTIGGTESFGAGTLTVRRVSATAVLVTLPRLPEAPPTERTAATVATRLATTTASDRLAGRWATDVRRLRMEMQFDTSGPDAVNGTIAYHPGADGHPFPLRWPYVNALEIVGKLRPFAISGVFTRDEADRNAFIGDPATAPDDPEIAVSYRTELRPMPSGNLVFRQSTQDAADSRYYLLPPLAGPMTPVPPPPGARVEAALAGVWTGSYHGVDLDLEIDEGEAPAMRAHVFAADDRADDLGPLAADVLHSLRRRAEASGPFALAGTLEPSLAASQVRTGPLDGDGFAFASRLEPTADGTTLDLYLRRASRSRGMEKPIVLAPAARPIRPIPQLAPPPEDPDASAEADPADEAPPEAAPDGGARGGLAGEWEAVDAYVNAPLGNGFWLPTRLERASDRLPAALSATEVGDAVFEVDLSSPGEDVTGRRFAARTASVASIIGNVGMLGELPDGQSLTDWVGPAATVYSGPASFVIAGTRRALLIEENPARCIAGCVIDMNLEFSMGPVPVRVLLLERIGGADETAPPPLATEDPAASGDGSGLAGLWRGSHYRMGELRQYADLDSLTLVDPELELVVEDRDGAFALQWNGTMRNLSDEETTFGESFDTLMVRYRRAVPELSQHLRLPPSADGTLVRDAIGDDARLYQWGNYELVYLSADAMRLLIVTDRFDNRDFALLTRISDAPAAGGETDPAPADPPAVEAETADAAPGGTRRGPVCAALFAREADLLGRGGTDVVSFVRGVFAGAGLAFGGAETEDRCKVALSQLDAYLPPATADGPAAEGEGNTEVVVAPTIGTVVESLTVFLEDGGSLSGDPGQPFSDIAPGIPDPCAALSAFDHTLRIGAGLEFAGLLDGLYLSLGFGTVDAASADQCHNVLVVLDDYGVDPAAPDGGYAVVDVVAQSVGPPAEAPVAAAPGRSREPAACVALFDFEAELLRVADTPLVQIIRGVFIENGLLDNPAPRGRQCAAALADLIALGADPGAPDGGLSVIEEIERANAAPPVADTCRALDRLVPDLVARGGAGMRDLIAARLDGMRIDPATAGDAQCEDALADLAALGLSAAKDDGGLRGALAILQLGGDPGAPEPRRRPRPDDGGAALPAFVPTPEPFADVAFRRPDDDALHAVPQPVGLASHAAPALTAFLVPAGDASDVLPDPQEGFGGCGPRTRVAPREAVRAWAGLRELMRHLGRPAAVLSGRTCGLAQTAVEAAFATLGDPSDGAGGEGFEAPVLDRRLDAIDLAPDSRALARETLRAEFARPPLAPSTVAAPWRLVVAAPQIVEALTGEAPAPASIVVWNPVADEVVSRFRMNVPGDGIVAAR